MSGMSGVPMLSGEEPGLAGDGYFLSQGLMLAEPQVQAQFSKMHMQVVGGSLAEAKRYVAADRERWSAIIKAGGIKPQ